MNVRTISWHEFRAKAEMVEKQAAFDPCSYPAYAMIFAGMAAELFAIIATDFTFTKNDYDGWFNSAIALVIGGIAARRYGLSKVGAMLEALGLPIIIGCLTIVGMVLVCRISAPFADDALITADRALGFDWLTLLAIYQQNPWMVGPSRIIYASLHVQTMLVPILVFAMGHRERGWIFINAWAIAAALTVLIFPFFPAVGPYVSFNLPRDALPGAHWDWPWTFGATIADIRSGHVREIGAAMTGLVSFPSFHAVGAILFAWAAWPLQWWRWPLLGLNMLVIFTTIIHGSHYLADLIGGGLVAVAAIWTATRLPRGDAKAPATMPVRQD